MSWIKQKLINWLELDKHSCKHQWIKFKEGSKTVHFQMPASKVGAYEIPNPVKTVFTKQVPYIVLRCSKCGDIKTVNL